MRSELSITDRFLQRAVAAHFDPDGGSPYWLDRQSELGICFKDEIQSVSDLAFLGPFEKSALFERPLRDFVPKKIYENRAEIILGESGGTTGQPVRTVFTPAEFEEGFGAPFVAVSGIRGFPTRGNWLFVGPSGPHIIGQASRLLARLHGALEPFTVDLDPRWARSQSPGSLGSHLYREHILDQALSILAREQINTLFITPPLALALADEMSSKQKAAIHGVHLGGMRLVSEDYVAIKSHFDNAVILPGYGNSMFGLFIEPLEPLPSPGGQLDVDYFPLPGRLHVSVVAETEAGPDLSLEVETGDRGRVVMSRFDESFFIPNLIERDQATRIESDPEIARLGLAHIGLRNPEPVMIEEAIHGVY